MFKKLIYYYVQYMYINYANFQAVPTINLSSPICIWSLQNKKLPTIKLHIIPTSTTIEQQRTHSQQLLQAGRGLFVEPHFSKARKVIMC